MSITDDDLATTNSAIAKLEGIEPSGDISEFNARKLTFGPDKAVIGPDAHLAAERIRLTALEWEHFEVRQVGATLGGIVKGLDLSKSLADEVVEELGRAWAEYKVMFFRDQALTAEQHIEFARRFGELEVHPFLPNNASGPRWSASPRTPTWAATRTDGTTTSPGARSRRRERCSRRSGARNGW